MRHHFLRQVRDWFPPGVLKFILNIWPPLLAAGIRVKYLAPNFREVTVQLKLHWYNTNYVGVHFGGSIYAMTDPFYMLILLKNLGDNYIIWDKAASIDFKKPGLGIITAHFAMSEEEINAIREQADQNAKYVFNKPVDIINQQNEVVASVIRTLYVKKKNPNGGDKR